MIGPWVRAHEGGRVVVAWIGGEADDDTRSPITVPDARTGTIVAAVLNASDAEPTS